MSYATKRIIVNRRKFPCLRQYREYAYSCAWFLDYMVVHLGLRTHDLLYEEIGKSIVKSFLRPREKAECYKEVANYS